MQKSKAPALRALLRNNPDGLSAYEIEHITGHLNGSITSALHKMPDIYIDRWVRSGRQGPPLAVWCAVPIPDNCPKPTYKKETK